jgi:hypothetical protein
MATEVVKVRIEKKSGLMKIECDGFVGEGCSAIEEIEMQLGTRTKHEDKDERFQYQLHTPATVGMSC